MKNPSKIVIDILIATAISLVINFSHLLLIFIDQDPHSTSKTQSGAPGYFMADGVLSMDRNGHGYVIYNKCDSAYISQGKASRYMLKNGDSLTVRIVQPSKSSQKSPTVHIVTYRNGHFVAPYASSTPQRFGDFVVQFLYYFLLSLTVILITSTRKRGGTSRIRFTRIALALVIASAMYLLAPMVSPRRRGEFIFNLLLRNQMILDYMIVLKWSFAIIVALLYSQIYKLLSQRQNIILENERLRSESINAQYNMLMSQINPHVLFNSLNSLSMLVRKGDEERSLTYIDHLSYTFRYILQNRESTLTTLAEEMHFVDAYIYLFKIRYAEKLFFDIEIDPQYDNYQIPALSLQPLLDNAVKHNTILSSRPFHVSIKVEQGVIKVANKRYPKLEAEPSTGVGLENLSRRWQLIANKGIEVIQDDESFEVRLPLIKPNE